MKESCLFCYIDRPAEFENELAYAVLDNFPVSKGHMLIIPRRHFASLFDAREDEFLALFNLLKQCKVFLDKKYAPDGYNTGINDGESAGQSVFHLHIHLIPRYRGDVLHPKGGIRNIIPLTGKPICPYEHEK